MSKMVERAAVAFMKALGDVQEAEDLTLERAARAARAAIEAMREPTDGMLNAARDWSIAKNGMGVGNDQASGCWQAMIDEVLK